MTRTALISLLLVLAPLGAWACSPAVVETPGPVQRGAQCSLIVPAQIGEGFASPAWDLGQGRVAQLFGDRNACDLNSSAMVTQCTTGARVALGPDVQMAQGDDSGALADIKVSMLGRGQLRLDAPIYDLAAGAARAGLDVRWIEEAWQAPAPVFAQWADVTCACATFYPGSEGAM